MPASGILHRMALVRTDVSEERSASISRVTRICEVGTTLAETSYVPPKRRVTQEPHGIKYQKTAFFIVTAAKTLNLTNLFTK
jgi:hypothetical protein